MSQQYTNELTPEILVGMDQSPFTPEQLAEISDEARTLIEEQKAFCRQHPVTAIYRIAVDGSLTQRGGVVRVAWNGSEIELEDGRKVNIALEGDVVVYPDGTTARITTGSGKKFWENEQEIARVGMPMGDDFLTVGA